MRRYANLRLPLPLPYSSVVIMGDINLHLDVQTDANTSSFSSLLAAHNLVQVVQTPTHTAGHLLDVVAVRWCLSMCRLLSCRTIL